MTELLRNTGNEAEVETTLTLKDDLSLAGPVKVKLHLFNTGDSVLVNGRAEGELELECSRCLQPFHSKVTAEIDEEFSKAPPQFKKKGTLDLTEADFVYPIDKDNSLDLTELVRQNLLLALPAKALCREDCSGIND